MKELHKLRDFIKSRVHHHHSQYKEEPHKLRAIIRMWLFVVVFVGFWLTILLTWNIITYMENNYAKEFLQLKMNDATMQVKHTQENLNRILDAFGDAAIGSAKSLSLMIYGDPTILKDTTRLEKIRQILGVDELHVSDEKGILRTSIPRSTIGFDMNSTEQSRPFMEAITNRKFQMWQKPMANGSANIYISYAGVSRLDKPGIVQVGYKAEHVYSEMRLADIEYLCSSFRIGAKGALSIARNPTPGKERPRFFKDTVNNMPSLCLSVPCGNFILTGNLPNDEVHSSRTTMMVMLIIANSILFTLIYTIIIIMLRRHVVDSIDTVNNTLEKITNGNLGEKVKVENTKEFKELSKGINDMVESLKGYIEKEARRLDAELEMGRTIQSSSLPVGVPDSEKIHLAAGMFAAKEVGGDFYDYFMIDNHHLAFLIADVSGKGLTAALYMMGSKATIKQQLIWGHQPADALTRANKELCRNNEMSMFLTTFLAVLDTETGMVSYVNAGHNPPAIKHKDGKWEYMNTQPWLVVGINPDVEYVSKSFQMMNGDRIFLYTDGVTEAENVDKQLFGEDRLLETLNGLDGTPTDFVDALKDKIQTFASGEPQSDDITMLMIDYKNDDINTNKKP